MSEEKFNLSSEDIESFEIDGDEKPIDRLRRNMPRMADFIEAYKDEMKPPTAYGMIRPEWTPPKLEFKVEQFKIGTADFAGSIKNILSRGWDIWQFTSTEQWLIIFFHRKADKVDSSLDS